MMAPFTPSEDSSTTTASSGRHRVLQTAKSAVTTLASNVRSGVQGALVGDTSRLTYEVKCCLDPASALEDDLGPVQSLCDAFGFGELYRENSNLYLETAKRDYQRNGWINRVRAKRDKEKMRRTLLSKLAGLIERILPKDVMRPRLELTYKRRYKVEGNDLGRAMELARSEGFVVSDKSSPYSVELDWGYRAMTLSFSNKVLVPDVNVDDLSDLSDNEIRRIVRDNMATEEANWLSAGWGQDLVSQTLFAGPLRYRKYLGKWKKNDIVLEVWPIPDGKTGETTYICELSFVVDDYVKAAALRAELISVLDDMHLLIHGDSLKTGTVLDACFGPCLDNVSDDEPAKDDTSM